MKKYLLLYLFLASISLSGIYGIDDSSSETYMTVRDVFIEKSDSNLEEAKKLAIEDAGNTAFYRAIGSSDVSYSREEIAECLEDFTIESEKFLQSSYRASITFRFNADKLDKLLRKARRSDLSKSIQEKVEILQDNKQQLSSGSRLLLVDCVDSANVYRYITDRLGSYSLKPCLYSISSNRLKFHYSKELADVFLRLGIGFRYDFSQ